MQGPSRQNFGPFFDMNLKSVHPPMYTGAGYKLSILPMYLQLEEQASKTVLSICTGPFNPTPTDIFIRVTPASTQQRDQYLGIETQISLLRRVDKGLRKRARPGRTPTTRDQGTLHSSALVDTPARHYKGERRSGYWQ
jgi:hypothetical protein